MKHSCGGLGRDGRSAGQGLAEYALILTLISIAVIAALTMMSGSIDAVLTQVANTI